MSSALKEPLRQRLEYPMQGLFLASSPEVQRLSRKYTLSSGLITAIAPTRGAVMKHVLNRRRDLAPRRRRGVRNRSPRQESYFGPSLTFDFFLGGGLQAVFFASARKTRSAKGTNHSM